MRLKNLKSIREDRGMTLGELAEETGCSMFYLSVIEHGYGEVSVENAEKIADVLNAEVDDLTGRPISEPEEEITLERIWRKLIDLEDLILSLERWDWDR